AGLRLGKRITADFFAARKRHEKLLFLLLRAEMVERAAVEGVLNGEDDARRCANPGDLLHHDGIADVIHPGAAIALGDRDACQPQLGGFSQSLAGKAACLVQFLGKGFHLGLGELAHAALQQLLLFCQLEVHRYAPPGTPQDEFVIVQRKNRLRARTPRIRQWGAATVYFWQPSTERMTYETPFEPLQSLTKSLSSHVSPRELRGVPRP